uniref:RING-type domain-containing protein n=1 Tax=Parastrongyloides trichosuri TaxID=131310 RepID=A0A0N4ZYA3_PARTI
MEEGKSSTISKAKVFKNSNNNKSNNSRRNGNFGRGDQLSSNQENKLTSELVNEIRENSISTKHVVDGLPENVTFTVPCEICYENREFFGMFSCNHCVCMQCLLKQTLFTENISCFQCRNEYNSIVFFRVNGALPTQYPPIDMQRCKTRYASRYNSKMQRKHNIIFGCSLTVQAYDHILGHRCYICDKADEDSDHDTFAKLKNHYWTKHKRKFCDVCVEHEKKFSSERIPFTVQELRAHLQGKKTAWEELATNGHVYCTFCKNDLYYGSEERFRHYRSSHQTCGICNNQKALFLVFNTFDDLLEHYGVNHYLCKDSQCRKAGICYGSEEELQLHISEQHKTSNRNQPVPLSFPSSLRNQRLNITNLQSGAALKPGEEKRPSNTVIKNSIVKPSSNTTSFSNYNYVNIRPGVGAIDNNAFPSLISTVPVQQQPKFSSQTTMASLISGPAPKASTPKDKNVYDATSTDFPSLLTSQPKGNDSSVWNSDNSKKLKKSLAKPVVSVTKNTKKDIPKPRDFDPNTWSGSSSSQSSNTIKNNIPRITGFVDFDEITRNQNNSSPLNNMSSLSTTLCSDDETSSNFIRADGFSTPANSIRPNLKKAEVPKKVPPLEAFPLLSNPYEAKKINATITSTGALDIESTEEAVPTTPIDFNSAVSQMFQNLSKK